MEKEILKKKLDLLAAHTDILTHLASLFETGPNRILEISKGQFLLDCKSLKSKFYWDISDPRTAVSCLVAQGFYEEIETQILTKIVKQCRTTLDIGANVGYYAVVLGKALNDHGALIAIEPLERAYNQLKSNLVLNDLLEKVTPMKIALGDKDGIAELHIPEMSGSSATSLRSLHPSEYEIRVSVETRSLDSLISEKGITDVDLIKIDVEGAEWLVIQGGWKIITDHRPIIFAELLRKWSAGFGYHPNIVLQRLKELNYDCFAVGRNLKPIDEINDHTQETNFIFLTASDQHKKIFNSITEII